MMSDCILEMKNVTKRFPGVVALKNVSMTLKKGEILGICGENGAGKSTLMKILSGSYSAGEYEGEIIINDKPVELTSVKTAEDLGIEMVYQEVNMIMDSDIAENLYVGNLPGKGSFVDFRTLYKKTQEILDYANIPVSPKEKARNLNSGQIQFLSLMRAYIKNPKILVLDEPTTALTNNETNLLMSILNELRQKGISCIYISHKLDEIYRICNRVLVIRDGETISCHNIDEVNEARLIEDMVGRKVETLYPKTHHTIGNEILKIEGLSIPHPTIKNKNIVTDISFSLRKGEILGIGGLVGSGRSEILGAIFGQITKGVTKKVFLNDKEISIKSPADAIGKGIGFATEDRKGNGIVWMLSIKQNMVLASLKDLPNRFFINKKIENERTKQIFDKLRIKAPSLSSIVNSLSGGNQQKVVLSKWLLKNPTILFMDEPTKGIDVGAKAEIYKLMGELTESGISIIMVSSDMPELVSLSDRVLVISNEHITGEFAQGEIKEEAIMAAAIK